MTELAEQAKLSTEQIQAFYHDEFVEDQVRDFQTLVADARAERVVVDVGGGCGFFAKRLSDTTGHRSRVIDMDPGSIEACREQGVDARIGDALAPTAEGDEDVACFNLILHHLVGHSERETRALQIKALSAWRGQARRLFVNEYIYQSFVKNLSGRLIYEITASQFLSFVGRQASRIIPSFRANTFGVGVRFRSRDEWEQLFLEAGYRVIDWCQGKDEHISPPLRSLMIKAIRRDSFVLEALPAR